MMSRLGRIKINMILYSQYLSVYINPLFSQIRFNQSLQYNTKVIIVLTVKDSHRFIQNQLYNQN